MLTVEEAHSEFVKRVKLLTEACESTTEMSEITYLKVATILHELGDVASMLATVQFRK